MQKVKASNLANSIKKINILIVDDHPVFRRGIASLLATESDLQVCGEACSASTAVDAMRNLAPDVVLMDISLPGTNGIELIKMLKAEQPKLTIIIVSMYEESLYALRALRAGALGYIMKTQASDHLLTALRQVMTGDIYVSEEFKKELIFKVVQSSSTGMDSPIDVLSDRELEVLQLLGRGMGTREVADALHLSMKTIETHRSHIKEKLGFTDSSKMIRFATDWVIQKGESAALSS